MFTLYTSESIYSGIIFMPLISEIVGASPVTPADVIGEERDMVIHAETLITATLKLHMNLRGIAAAVAEEAFPEQLMVPLPTGQKKLRTVLRSIARRCESGRIHQCI